MTTPAHNRHTIRLPGYDYAQPGAYYVTIVTRERVCALGSVVDGNVNLSGQGIIAQKLWQDLPKHFQQVMLDEFVIVPNHIHGILMIMDDDGTIPGVMEIDCRGRSGDGITAASQNVDLPLRANRGRGLPEMIRAFKSFSARKINQMNGTPGQPFWQRNYFEHVIRNETELQKIRQYIRNNPLRWNLDEENPHAKREQQEVGCVFNHYN